MSHEVLISDLLGISIFFIHCLNHRFSICFINCYNLPAINSVTSKPLKLLLHNRQEQADITLARYSYCFQACCPVLPGKQLPPLWIILRQAIDWSPVFKVINNYRKDIQFQSGLFFLIENCIFSSEFEVLFDKCIQLSRKMGSIY